MPITIVYKTEKKKRNKRGKPDVPKQRGGTNRYAFDVKE